MLPTVQGSHVVYTSFTEHQDINNTPFGIYIHTHTQLRTQARTHAHTVTHTND